MMGALSVRDGGDHRSKKIAPIGMPKAGHWFVPDSPLEGRVTSEPVSEMGFSGTGKLRSRFQDVYGIVPEA